MGLHMDFGSLRQLDALSSGTILTLDQARLIGEKAAATCGATRDSTEACRKIKALAQSR